MRVDFAKAMRLAVSHTVQSVSGDLMRMAVLNLVKFEESNDVTLVGQVHDNFIVEVPESWSEEQVQKMFSETLLMPQFPFKLRFDCK